MLPEQKKCRCKKLDALCSYCYAKPGVTKVISGGYYKMKCKDCMLKFHIPVDNSKT